MLFISHYRVFSKDVKNDFVSQDNIRHKWSINKAFLFIISSYCHTTCNNFYRSKISRILSQRHFLCYTPLRPLQNRVTSMDKKEKALRFGISILESVSDLLTAAVVGILLVAGLIHYFN